MDQKDCAVTLVVIIIPSVDVIMEILAETVKSYGLCLPCTPQRMESCQLCKVLERDKSKSLTLNYCSGVLHPFDIGRVSLFLYIYTALQSSSDVLNRDIFFFMLISELHCIVPRKADEAQRG